MSRSVMGRELLFGLSLILSTSLVACVGDDEEIDESTDSAAEELVSAGGSELGHPGRAAALNKLGGAPQESGASVPGGAGTVAEPEPVPWQPPPKDPKPASPETPPGDAPLPT